MMPIAASRPVPAYDSKASVRSSFCFVATCRSFTIRGIMSPISSIEGPSSFRSSIASKSSANCLNLTCMKPPGSRGSGSPAPYSLLMTLSAAYGMPLKMSPIAA